MYEKTDSLADWLTGENSLKPQISQISRIREGGNRGSAIDFFVPDEFLRRLLPSSFASVICEICGICGFISGLSAFELNEN
jgi:hypothetical protein